MIRFILAALLALVMAGCGTKAPEQTGPVKQYTMIGEVLKLDPDNSVATIKHQAIKGWMGAMTMEYPVKEKAEFAKLHIGDRITATVYVQGDDYWVGQIKPGQIKPGP